MIRRALVAVGAATIVLCAGVAAGATPRASDDTSHVRRVLVFSLPYVTWADLDRYDLPNLRRLLDASAVADLTTRVERRSTRLADGYLTFEAGTRAVGDPTTDGDVLGVNERFGKDTAGEVFLQRTGHRPKHGIVSLGKPRIVDRNDSLLYDAEVGALADALAGAGIGRAVIANADGSQPDTPPSPQVSELHRQAGLGLMSSHGTVPRGRVDAGLLESDPAAPYGVRLDEAKVVDTFDKAWRDRSVVLVEASDLVRADAYREFASSIHREVMLRRALRRSDHLLGRLLRRVDLRRDAVVVFGPAHGSRAIALTVLGVHAPGVEPGLLRSATTRRSGFVQLVDVGPTVLHLLDVDRPTSMEGRPAETGREGGSATDRRDFMIREDTAAQFRDKRVGEITIAVVVFAAALVAATIVWLRRPAWRERWREALLFAPLAVISFLPAVFLARLVPLHEVGFVPYWAYLVVVSGVLGGIAWAAGRRHRLDSLIAALLIVVVLLVVDVVRGAPLIFNSALGYSPTVAGRFTGLGNPAYAALASSALLAAALLAFRIGAPRGRWVAVALLAGAVIVDGAPWWGSDVGGILSMVPAYLVFLVLLFRVRVRWRTVMWCALALVLAVAGFAALDLSRPSDQRTHLGRLLERIDERGFGDFVVVVERKLSENLGSIRSSAWGLMLLVVFVLLVWLSRRAPERLAALTRRIPEWRPAWIAFIVLAALGYALNDSGITVPGVMLAVFMSSLVFLLAYTSPVAQRATRSEAVRSST